LATAAGFQFASEWLLWVDCVDLVGNTQRQRKNRIQASRFLNQNCAPDSRFESILLTFSRQNVYQHNLPKAEIVRPPTKAPTSNHGLAPCFPAFNFDRCKTDSFYTAISIEVFDKRGVSFVSVTQQFNTTTSMGRLTLNGRSRRPSE